MEHTSTQQGSGIALAPLVLEAHTKLRWSLIPLHDKRRPVVAWKPFQEKRPSLITLLDWQSSRQPSMWAVVTGSLSGVVVLDFDGCEGLATLETLDLSVRHVTTPSGGAHVHVAHPGAGVRVLTRQRLDPSRWPSMDSRGDGGYAVISGGEYVWHGHELLPWDALPEKLRDALTHPAGGVAAAARSAEATRHVPEGERHDHLVRVGGAVAATGVSAEAVRAAIEAESEAVCEAPQDGAEVARQSADIARRYAGQRRYEISDLGNAERLADLRADELRFVPGLGWHVWDGRRWRRDTERFVVRMAGDVARSRYLELLDGGKDDKTREALIKWARQSESEPRIRAAINLTESLPGMVVRPDALDADPWLLNVRNGTIELKTGELREHRRDDLITKLASVEYDPEAEDKRWGTFLGQVTDGDDVLAGFLARAVGCTLVGFASEEAIFFVHGPGATGKTTFVEAVKTALGDYALTTGFDTFLRKRAGGIPVDIARFPGARLVVASEVDEGQRLAEGMVKQLTGGDTVTARHLYSSPFEFKPQMTLWFVANSRPAVVGSDDGFWRRMTQIPFLRVVPEGERNIGFKRQLTQDPAALAAVASWAVRGCLDWQRVGLEVPQKVRDYTADYRTENSPIDRWMSDELAFEPEAITTNGELRASLESWVRANEFKEIPWTAVPKALKKLGCESTKIGGTRGWRGVKVDFERDLDTSDGQDGKLVKVPNARALERFTEQPSKVSEVSTPPALSRPTLRLAAE